MSSVDNCFIVVFPLSLSVESISPPVVLSRTLQHAKELELEDQQILALLRVARRHHDDFFRIAIEFINLSTQLDLLEARPNLAQKRRLIARHARLFQEHEGLLLRAHQETARILSAEQMRRVVRIHESQRTQVLRGLLPGLRRALAPGFTIAPKPRKGRRIRRRPGSAAVR